MKKQTWGKPVLIIILVLAVIQGMIYIFSKDPIQGIPSLFVSRGLGVGLVLCCLMLAWLVYKDKM